MVEVVSAAVVDVEVPVDEVEVLVEVSGEDDAEVGASVSVS